MALEIFRLVGSVFVDTDQADKSLQKTDKTAEGFGTKLVNVGKAAGKFAAGVVGAASAAGAGLVALTENTREYRTEQGKLQTAFTTSGFSADAARTTYESLNGVLGDSGQAVEAANHLAKLATNEEDLAKWTDICTGVYATFGDSLPIEGLTEAANETAKTGALTGGLADALNWAGVNEEAFQESLDACNNEQERQALITETLNGLYSEAADTYRDVNGEVIAANEAQDKMNESMASLGSAVEPLITQGKALIAEVLMTLIPYITQFAEVLLPVLLPLLSNLASGVLPLLMNLVQQLLPPIMEVVQLLLPILVDLLQRLLPPVIQIVQTLLPPLLQLLMPILDLLQPILDLLQPILDLVVSILAPLAQLISGLLTPLISIISKVISVALVPLRAQFSMLSEILSNTVKAAIDMIMVRVNAIKGVFSGLIQFVKGVFTGNWKQAWEGVKKIFGSVLEGIKNSFKIPINWIIDGINVFIRGLNKLKIPDWVPGVGGKGLNIATIPNLEKGGVLERGQVGLLEGNGAEAVVPLHQNQKWISAVARDMDSAVGGSNGQTVALLRDILDVLENIADAGTGLDRSAMIRALVDLLAKPMDKRLGQLQAAKARA